MEINILLATLTEKMDKTIAHLRHEFGGLRTGRASAALLDSIKVSVYGAEMPLTQLATVSVPESRMISVSVWDRANVNAVEKAIRESNLGLNPATDGTLMRLPIPPLTEERRRELAKFANTFAEAARVGIRNIRKDGNDSIKTAEKAKEISEDQAKGYENDVQDLTNKYIKEIDDIFKTKEADIMTV